MIKYKFVANKLKGEQRSNSVLTENDIREIRKLNAKYKIGKRKLSQKYRVSESVIQRILSKKSWKHVE